ncbi:hypothetical protein QWJ34_12465 [Saccharibacillus sp. CPCC 101409]|uniref:hypothetical protein n=1 Tax=Saccharibacillus sp. CPCC 101409 TaxID=3058041 RepID=UPI002673F80E|nr:hypothetical protein [Saccharibacillus sp. CPCC 101409]MDO3410577.1 hypothetical protein [Saccharibacillus sp. CPCC 101409]
MDIFSELDNMQELLFESDLEDIEDRYFHWCCEKAGQDQAEQIRDTDLTRYEGELQAALKKAVSAANKKPAKAIYFEYDMDNLWDGTFFICQEYNPLAEEDDEWACDWLEDLSGPDLKEFAEIYKEARFDSPTAVYLIARTAAAFTRQCRIVNFDKPSCIAFHDQDPIMRTKKD